LDSAILSHLKLPEPSVPTLILVFACAASSSVSLAILNAGHSTIVQLCTWYPSSSEHPDRVEAMVAMWEQYKTDNTVLDISLDLAETMK
jgi:hypothetical protein